MFIFSMVDDKDYPVDILSGFHFPVPFRNSADHFQKMAPSVFFLFLKLTWVWMSRSFADFRDSPKESSMIPRSSTHNQVMKESFISGVSSTVKSPT